MDRVRQPKRARPAAAASPSTRGANTETGEGVPIATPCDKKARVVASITTAVPKRAPSAMVAATPSPLVQPLGRHLDGAAVEEPPSSAGLQQGCQHGKGPANDTKMAASTQAPVTKRVEGVVSWDEYFMAVAFLSSQRSKGGCGVQGGGGMRLSV